MLLPSWQRRNELRNRWMMALPWAHDPPWGKPVFNLLNGTMWIPFQFRLMSGDTATKSRWPWPCETYILGGRQILILFTCTVCIGKRLIKKNKPSVYSSMKGFRVGNQSALMLQGREPPLMSWFSGAHPEATGKLPEAHSQPAVLMQVPLQKPSWALLPSLMSTHLAAAPLEHNVSLSPPGITCPTSALMCSA